MDSTIRFPAPDPARAREYRAQGHWRDETILQRFAQCAAARPDKVAVRDAAGTCHTYRRLEQLSARVAGFLARRGVGAGDVVTVCLPNWSQTVTVFLAVLKLGAVINPVPVTYGRAELAFVLGKCRSKALFVAGRFRSNDYTVMLSMMPPELVAPLTIVRLGEGRHALGVAYETVLDQPPLDEAHAGEADDVAALLFTSGTESRAKGGVHTHNTILFGERAMAEALAIGAEDVAFMASPIAHATGFLHGFAMTLTTGGTLSLLDVFSGEAAARQMREHGCTWTMGATPFLADTVAALSEQGQTLPELRYFLCGGAPVPEAPVRAAWAMGIRVLSIYGATESPPHTVVHPADPIENSWLSDGRPLRGIEVRIVGPGGETLPVGEVGEEWSRGPNTFIGYLDEPELSRKAMDDEGWVHSGDLARRLPDGSIRLTGRLKEIIVRGGQNISVSEVENHLMSHPAVRIAAVVGIPHPRLGETGCAVVVPRDGRAPTLEELTRFLLDKGVARFKLPERLEVWPSLPTTPTGKIQKFLIRRTLEGADPPPS